jgi:Tripartite tricarboxylate transporter TctB family
LTDRKQFWSGIVFLLIGAAALLSLPRPLGSLSSMGPGYFPMILGSGLVLTGSLAVAFSMRGAIATTVAPLPIVPACFVLGGVVAFALLITEIGLAVSLLILVAASCYGRLIRRPFEVAVIYAVLLPLTWVIFVYAVQLPISLF